MAKIAYIRVLCIDQNTDRQEIALKEFQIDRSFSEKASGRNTDRSEFKKMMEYVREGDTLYIESISRLARSTKNLLNIVEQLQNKKVELVSLKENMNTSTHQDKFILTIFVALAELERENTLQRQREGIEAAKIKGKCFGRPKIEVPKEFARIYKQREIGNIKAVQAFKSLNIKKTTFYKIVKQYEETLD